MEYSFSLCQGCSKFFYLFYSFLSKKFTVSSVAVNMQNFLKHWLHWCMCFSELVHFQFYGVHSAQREIPRGILEGQIACGFLTPTDSDTILSQTY